MRIYAFAANYPSAYKPYYDTQFASLISAGHDLRIFAFGSLDSVVNDKVRAHRLDERTTYYYSDGLGPLAHFAPRIATGFIGAPLARSRSLCRLARHEYPFRSVAKHAARMLTLPIEPPDLCIVNGHRTMTYVPWLRDLFPGVPVALFYYGGEPIEAGMLEADSVRHAFAQADVVFALTEYARMEAIERGCNAAITSLAPIGFDLHEYEPPSSRDYRPNGVLRLTSASRLSEGKGHIYTLEALAQLRAAGLNEFRYTIIGDGPLRGALEAYVRDHGLAEHVVFTGTMANAEVIPALAQADALILSSHSTPTWTETQGAILQEAMLMQTLVVTTTTGGVPESIPPEMTPFAAEPADVQTLVGALRRVYHLPEAQMRALGQSVRAWTAANYDVDVVNGRVFQEIRERIAATTKKRATTS